MTDALRFESVRISTIRSTYWIGLLGLVLCALVSPWASGWTPRRQTFPPLRARFCSLPVEKACRSQSWGSRWH